MKDTLSSVTKIMGEMARVRNILSEIKTFEEGGLIRDPTGKINLEKLVEDSRLYLDGLSQTFGKIKEDLSGSILSLTSTAYLTFFDTKFLGEKPDRSTKYNPHNFLEATHRLSFEMSNSGNVAGFYDALTSNFSQSTKFVYNLVVKDLCRVLDEVKGRSDYSKEAFTGFALDVLAQALPYSQGRVVDKWSVFKGQFDAIKNKYFSDKNGGQDAKSNHHNVTIGYILGLIEEGDIGTGEKGADGKEITLTPAGRFRKELDVCCIHYESAKGSNRIRVKFDHGDLNDPKHYNLLTLQKGKNGPVKSFFVNVGEAVLAYLRQKEYSGPLIITTNEAIKNIRNHL